MSLEMVFCLIRKILLTMRDGEIRLIVRGGRIKHVNVLKEAKLKAGLEDIGTDSGEKVV